MRLVRNPRARRLTLRVDRLAGEVRVTLPLRLAAHEAAHFVRVKQQWIADRLSETHVRQPVRTDSILPYRGGKLRIDWHRDHPRAPRLEQDDDARAHLLILGGPESAAARRVQSWLKTRCAEHSRQDLAFYCEQAGQPTPDLTTTTAQKRWGSCSEKGVIRINWRLVLAPDWVRRSVVAHEVAHLAEMNHGPRFYALLDRIYEGERREADAWLKQNGPGLYAWDFG